jgi:phage N-6-adenine-methyltransferase
MHKAAEPIQIDPEFRALIPPLSDEERMQLEENLLRDGCRDPLVTWNSVLLDGHNRYDICLSHSLAFDTVSVDLPDRQAAEDWIDSNQLGRRNLTPDQASLLRGRRYNRAKKPQGGTGANQYQQTGQNVQSATAERLAQQHGVTERTIRRDGDFAEAVETLKPHIPDIEQRVLSGDVPSKAAVVEAAREPDRAEQILGKPHVSHNSGNNEWYTPPEIIAAARASMGNITLDPASSAIANRVVCADAFFTSADNGLTQSWRGSVWMNPPYAQPLVAQFAEAVSSKYEAKEIKRACVLVNNATETGWFQRMLGVASAVCFLRGRVRFLDVNGEPSGMPLQGQAVLYLGENPYRFAKSFGDLGLVLMRPE